MNEVMNFKEIRQAIAQAPKIFVWVNLVQDEGQYIEAKKGSVLMAVNSLPNSQFKAEVRADGLYID